MERIKRIDKKQKKLYTLCNKNWREALMTGIFYMDISDFTPRIYSEILSLLPEERRAKAERYAFKQDKYLSAAAGYALYVALKERGINYSSAKIITGKNGKPYLDGGKTYFSLSHSGNIALCAVSDNEVGADVQEIKPLKRDISPRILTDDEAAALRPLSEDEKTDFLFRIWTEKESVMKFSGLGFALPFKDIDVLSGVKMRGKETRLFLKEYPLAGYKICVCSALNSFAEKLKELRIVD